MATPVCLYIKNISKEILTEEIVKYYSTGRLLTLNYKYPEAFFDKMNYAFILSDWRYEGWIELDLKFNNSREEHDFFLSYISNVHNTTVLFGYAQTTEGEARFTAYKNGVKFRSIYLKSYDNPHRIILEENIGDRLFYELSFKYQDVGKEVDSLEHDTLDFYTDIYAMANEVTNNEVENKSRNHDHMHIEYVSQ